MKIGPCPEESTGKTEAGKGRACLVNTFLELVPLPWNALTIAAAEELPVI